MQQDEEEAARVRREQDKLLHRDVVAYQWIFDLLAEAEKEWDLKLVAEENLTALEQRASQDAEVVA